MFWRGVLVVTAVCATRAAVAGPIRLEYSAPAECPAAADIEREIAAKLADEAADDPVEIKIDGDDIVGYRGVLVTRADGNAGRREVHGATCGETAAALVLVAAIAIAAPRADAEAPRIVAQPTRPRAPPARSRDSETRLYAGAGLALYEGVTPNALYALPIQIAARRGRGELRVTFDATRMDRLEMATFRWIAGRLDVCYDVVVLGRVALGPCGGAQVGTLEGRGRMVDQPEGQLRPWLAPELAARATLRLGPAALAIEVLAAMPLFRDRYYIAPTTTVHEVPAVVYGVSVTAAVQFW